MFDYKGVMYYPASVASEDAMMEAAIEAGAEDVQTEGDTHRITCAPHDFGAVKPALEAKFGKPDAADFEYLPKQWQPVTDEDMAVKINKLTAALDDDDDVQTVTTNMELSDALAAKLHG
jgi:transcriptional/translational regulatory protein YebC/TACO1